MDKRMGKGENFELDSLYLVAVLKVRQELGRAALAGFEEWLSAALSELGIDEGGFARYLKDHKEDLIRTCQEVGV